MKKHRKTKSAKAVELAELFKRKRDIENKNPDELSEAIINEYRKLLRRLHELI